VRRAIGSPTARRCEAACQLVLQWAFQTAKLERVIACIDDTNELRRAIALKIGMTELSTRPPNRTVYCEVPRRAQSYARLTSVEPERIEIWIGVRPGGA